MVFITLFVFLFDFISLIKNLNDKEYKKYYQSSFLLIFNPWVFTESIIQLLGELFLKLQNKADKETTNKYALPFKEKWSVFNGGVSKETSHSWELITQRYAYDFIMINEKNESFKTDPNKIDNYYCYEQPLFAALDGKVVKIKNNVNDYQKVGDYSIDWKTKHIAGNYITIKHSNNEYSFYAHLKRNSLLVKEGDIVKKGQLIATCGNSGNSTEPHLHFQIMDSKHFFFGRSLKIRFENLMINDTKKDISFIQKEEIVSNL